MIAVRPPEYLPGLAFMALMQSVQCFVLADTFQYSRQSFHNRTKLRTPQGWQWISIPLKGGQHGTPIRDVHIDRQASWGRKHWRSFEYNYGTAPFFRFYADNFHDLLTREWHYLGELTCATVELLHGLLNLKSRLVRASVLEGEPASLLDVLHAMGDSPLLVPEEAVCHDEALVPGVETFFYSDPEYRQNFDGFVAGMSAVDLLFNYGPEAASVLRQGVRLELGDAGSAR